MKISIALLCCVTTAFSAAKDIIPSSLGPKIIGGTRVALRIGYRTSMASVRKGGQHYCGACYIDRLFILTAANCLHKMLNVSRCRPFEAFSVSLGGISRYNHKTFDVRNVDSHKDYEFVNSGHFSPYDIGVILMSGQNITLRYAKRQSYADISYESMPTAVYVVRGWGSTTTVKNPNDSVIYEQSLREIKVRIPSNADCSRMLGGIAIHENLMCITGNNQQENVGMGDVGNPVILLNSEVMIAVVIHVFIHDSSLPAICIRITRQIMEYIDGAKNRLSASINVPTITSERRKTSDERNNSKKAKTQ